MKKQSNLLFKLPTRSLVFFFSISSSIIFLTFIIIWVNKTTPSNSVGQAQETSSGLQFNTSTLVLGFRPPIGAVPVQTNLTGNFNTNISVTINSPEEFTSGFSRMNSLVSSGFQTKENQSQVLQHDEEDTGGGELEGSFTAVAQSTPAILFDKIEMKTEEQNTPWNKTEEQNTPWNNTEEQNTPWNKTQEQNTPLSKTQEQNTPLNKTQEQNTPLNKSQEQNAASGFSGVNSLISGLKEKENQSQLAQHDEEDRGGLELNFTAVAPQSAPAILFDKIELSTEEQNAPLLNTPEGQNAPLMNKTEEQVAQSMTKTEEKKAPLMNTTEEQNAALMNKTEEQTAQLMTKTEEQNAPLRNTTEEENASLLNTIVEQNAPLMNKTEEQNSPLMNKTEEQTAPLLNKTEVQDAPLMNKTEEQNAASGVSGINSLVSGLQGKENESQVAEVAQSALAVSFDKIEIKTEEPKAPLPLMNKTEAQNAAASERIEVKIRKRRGKNKKNRGTSFDQKAQVSSSEVPKNNSPISFDQKTQVSSSEVQAEDKKILIKGGCDFSTRGKWVYDKSYPLYTNRSCPFIFEGFDCQGNGRTDQDYIRWRWQPQDCDIPRFNAKKMLELLRGKRLLYVGDSINRNQFESMVCMLVGDIRDPNRPRIKHEKGMYSFSFVDYKCKVEFSPSVFLVDKSMKRVGKKQVPTLRIDSIDRISYHWRGADIMVFDTEHWWTDQKTNAGVNFYQEGDQIHPYLDVYTALRKGMMTWASWVDKHTDPRKTQVFFRTSSPTHFSGGEWKSRRSCIGGTKPLLRDSGITNEKDRIAVEVIKQMKTRVTLLNITSMSEYRIDAHASHIQDCSHWCLPGLPDIWNELLYHHLLTN